MISVYVETNFFLELVFQQEEYKFCKVIAYQFTAISLEPCSWSRSPI